MKLTTALLLIGCLHTAATGLSQESKVTLDLRDVSIPRLFKAIEKKTAYRFVYSNDILPPTFLVSVTVNETPVTSVLRTALVNTGLIFNMVDDEVIVVSKALPPGKASITVTGTVTDESGNPLSGVSVYLKGAQSVGTVTNDKGLFKLEITESTATLVFSSVGMETKEVPLNGKTALNVFLRKTISQQQEIVVIGYGTQRKGDLTSAVATVKADNFVKGSVIDAGQLLQGKVAGLAVSTPSGDPTSGTQILLRGRTTLLGANLNPLILIDGVPGDLKTVAPQDIESIDILKDGSAAAIYGTRGTNGVILITTRRASANYKSTVEYSTYASTQTVARKLDISTAADYRAQVNAGYRDKSWDLGSSTDWIKEISRTPFSHQHNLTIRGGNSKTNYLLNANYNQAEGIFKKSDNQTFTARADINHSMFDDKVKINASILNSSNKYTTTADGYSFNGYVYRQALIQNPTAPIRDSTGKWFQQPSIFEYENPVSDLYESDGRNNSQNSRFRSTISYTPIQGLKLSAVLSYSKWNEDRGYSQTKQNISTLRDGKNGYASIGAAESIDRLAELTAEYGRSIGRHNFKILGGYSYQENEYRNFWMQNWNFPTDLFGYSSIQNGLALKDGLAPEYSIRTETNLIGFFGRITYNYGDKYLFMASLRREAASQLWGTKNPWGNFPAVSAGWRISKENFMQGQTLFNDLKLRAGYGVTGSQPSDLFLGVSLIGYDRYAYSNGNWQQTLIPTQNPNPDLRWEEKHESNFGLDFSMLNDRVSGSVDYYIRRISGLLFDYAVPSPPNLYPSTRANVGKMENKGVEIMLNIVPVRSKDLEWISSVSFSTNSSKLISLSNTLYKASSDYFTTGYTGPPVQTFTHIVKVGQPIGNFYGFKVIDIGNDPADAANYGQWIYEGADGKPVKYTDFKHAFEDKKVIGNGLPKYYAGWNNNFRYKRFDLSITQRGAFKFQVANFQRMMYENPTFTQYNLLKSAFNKVYGKTLLKSPQEFNSYYIENGDYWKIDNITFGYTVNDPGIKYIQSIRVYASVLNALIITGYKGIDPDVTLLNTAPVAQSGINVTSAPALAPGIDNRDKYPTTRTWTLGLNVSF